MKSTKHIYPLSISTNIFNITDGNVYKLPKLRYNTPNVFSSIAFTDTYVVKRPNPEWIYDFYRYIIKGERGDDVRYVLPEEQNIDELIKKFPEFNTIFEQHKNYAHFLMVHRLQYERLKSANSIKIPQSRFVLTRKPGLASFKKSLPSIIQERISGTPLLRMVEDKIDAIIPRWIEYIPSINDKLRALLDSDYKHHLNWYISNFMYDHKKDVLWYVDLKPSCLFAKIGNVDNIRGLQKIFFQYN